MDLEQLVADELRPTIAQLVQKLIPQLVAEELNGAAFVVEPRPPIRCRHCGETKPRSAFEPHRHICRACRRDQLAAARERRQEPAEEPEGPPSPSPSSSGSSTPGWPSATGTDG